MVVKFRMSAKRMVTRFFWPVSRGRSGVKDALGDLGGDVSAEDFLHAFTFLQAFDHFVEGGGELADFVLAGEWECELADRLRDRAMMPSRSRRGA